MANVSDIIRAFSEDQVARLTGISKRQLRHWDAVRLFVPSLAYEDRSRPYSRLYSFRDLVSLKVLNRLRNEARVPIRELQKTKEKLLHLGDEMWIMTTLQAHNKRVVFLNPETDVLEEVVSGQGILIPLWVETDSMEEAVRGLSQRGRDLVGKFERQRGIAHNQLVVAGTRIPVRTIKAFADAGYSVNQIRREYPTLTEEDIEAAINIDAAA